MDLSVKPELRLAQVLVGRSLIIFPVVSALVFPPPRAARSDQL